MPSVKPDVRVLHVIPAVASRYGGPSRAIFPMCRALASTGFAVVIATTDADGAGRLDVTTDKVIDFDGVPTVFFPRTWSQRFGYSSGLALWLAQEAAHFDVVHIHAVFSHPCLAAGRACRRQSVPYIVRPLGSLDPWSLRQRALIKRLMWVVAVRRLLMSASAIHYTTDEERRLAESTLGLTRGTVIPLGIEVPESTDAERRRFRQQYPALGDHPYILTMSRLHPKKNLELLIEAFAGFVRTRPHGTWRLLICGDGEAGYAAMLKNRAQNLGVADRVVFAGWLEGMNKASALRDAMLLALPSHQENFGLAVVEALACGVPVIVSEHVNLAPDIARCRAGWVTSLTPEALATALSDAFDDQPDRRTRGIAGRAFVTGRFAWPTVAAQLARLYASVHDAAGAGGRE